MNAKRREIHSEQICSHNFVVFILYFSVVRLSSDNFFLSLHSVFCLWQNVRIAFIPFILLIFLLLVCLVVVDVVFSSKPLPSLGAFSAQKVFHSHTHTNTRVTIEKEIQFVYAHFNSNSTSSFNIEVITINVHEENFFIFHLNFPFYSRQFSFACTIPFCHRCC